MEVACSLAKPLRASFPIGGGLGHENCNINLLLSQDFDHLLPLRTHGRSAEDRVKLMCQFSSVLGIRVENDYVAHRAPFSQ
jgi:hypothetical protein